MILKLLSAAALVAAPVPASAPDQPMLVFVNYPGVYRVDCREGKGTAFRVGKKHFFSVAHVAAMHECTIEGHPITITEQDGEKDFSQFDADFSGPILKLSCEGYQVGRYYWALGFAHGFPYQTAVAAYATYAVDDVGRRVFIGEYAFIPGMSGGVVMRSDGAVVGMVNAYLPGTGISFSRDLRDTSVCSKR